MEGKDKGEEIKRKGRFYNTVKVQKPEFVNVRSRMKI